MPVPADPDGPRSSSEAWQEGIGKASLHFFGFTEWRVKGDPSRI
jgi:hypothetical protein